MADIRFSIEGQELDRAETAVLDHIVLMAANTAIHSHLGKNGWPNPTDVLVTVTNDPGLLFNLESWHETGSEHAIGRVQLDSTSLHLTHKKTLETPQRIGYSLTQRQLTCVNALGVTASLASIFNHFRSRHDS